MLLIWRKRGRNKGRKEGGTGASWAGGPLPGVVGATAYQQLWGRGPRTRSPFSLDVSKTLGSPPSGQSSASHYRPILPWAAIRNYHKLGCLNNGNSFLLILGVGKSRPRRWPVWLLGRPASWRRRVPSRSVLTRQRELWFLHLLVRAPITSWEPHSDGLI